MMKSYDNTYVFIGGMVGGMLIGTICTLLLITFPLNGDSVRYDEHDISIHLSSGQKVRVVLLEDRVMSHFDHES